jgi:prophage tail gpP-like protein
MATFTITPSGAVEDSVRIDLGGQTCAIVEQYEVKQSFFTQPSAWSVTVGSGETAYALLSRFPARTSFALHVGPVLVMTGTTDGYTVSDGSGATTLTLRGRDQLAPLIDADAEADRSYSGASWTQVVTEQMSAAGIEEFTLFGDNAANRSSVAGVALGGGGGASTAALRASANVAEMRRIKAKQEADILALKGTAGPTLAIVTPGKPTQLVRQGITVVDGFRPAAVPEQTAPAPAPAKDKALKIKAGEQRYNWLRGHMAKAGLFLFAAAGEDTYVLAQPDTSTRPVARLLRQRGGTPDANGIAQGSQAAAARLAVNVLRVRHRNETTGRHTRYVVHGRGGRGAAGRGSLRGEFVDEEMRALGFPDTLVKVEAEREVKSDAQAAYEARRLCMTARREGWEYVATVQGHSYPALVRPGERGVWAVDTMVEVLDDELGIRMPLWVADVAFRRGADGSTTELTLHRPGDLVFGDADYL